MQYLSPPVRIADLKKGDRFYFEADVSQNALKPGMVMWKFHFELRSGVFMISQVDQTIPFGAKPDMKGRNILVRRITFQ